MQDKDGNTALHTAIRFGTRQEILKILLSRTEHVNLINKNGKTALHLACEHQQKDSATIKLLVEAGADTKALDYEGNSAAILAISSSPFDCQQVINIYPVNFTSLVNFFSIIHSERDGEPSSVPN